ncbi:xylulose 5-phosphate 3-epimerase [Alteromonas pelagimontana]|uniref:Xylulose 5-phosphate 3-epimerase n=1 Tax=Alteromonas pelagimontana TaxID=1858656 RepID=A0A6M4MGA5_9ALTE|nr:xylulose 5-phosphate 3-epimerase [Alteromonas pelagimontana]QJR81670.1 xylulose 5-phosphate 3-epimerase [Alteromonas pelagimontana]
MNVSQNKQVQRSFDDWAKGYGVITHKAETVSAVNDYIETLVQASSDQGRTNAIDALALLKAADHVCSASMWLIAHMTYANKVKLDGEPLTSNEFKQKAQGHTGGSLNMAPAYTGYMLANALSGKTRSWLMGQGHCVAAIEAVNAITGNQYDEKAQLYSPDEEGLSQLCYDFYRYELGSDGKQVSRVGSHVNVHTAGGIVEGGYLGFTELQYVHMPLPGQELVTFMSDGAFEEQRGSDWASHWWRAWDTGLVMPIMIANGRRIDQRSLMEQKGGAESFKQHLALKGFDPFIIDGSDPAAFALAILTMVKNLKQRSEDVKKGGSAYPVRIPYAIAEVAKGYGMPAAGENAAHSLPLGSSLRDDSDARAAFHQATRKLHVAPDMLFKSVKTLTNHEQNGRVWEKDHELRCFQRRSLTFPATERENSDNSASCMTAIDKWFAALLGANKEVRFRVGNPDEITSNRMAKTLAHLKHRVINPENEETESLHGGIITALNEEAVVSAALANKQGVGLVVSYEAFAMKMLGAMRQELIFARNLKLNNRPPNWISVPIIATSHTWENGKNEQSHQDPGFAEKWMTEMADVAPVYFPVDANTAVATLQNVYQTYGRIAAVVVAKKALPVVTTAAEAEEAVKNGCFIATEGKNADIQLLAIGGYQLQACIEAAQKLREQSVSCSVIALLEPGKFRKPRDEAEAEYCHTDDALDLLISPSNLRIIVSHTGADVVTGVLRRLDLGPKRTTFLGYRNQGGTLDRQGMQSVNHQAPEHIVQTAKSMLFNNQNDIG